MVTELDLSFTKSAPTGPLPVGLRRLTLDGCHWLTDEFLEEISRSNCDLEHVSLYWCVKVSDPGVKALLAKNRKISILSLSGVSKVTDESLEAISECLGHNLTSLDLTRLPRISQAGLLRIGENCKNLKSLNLYATTQISGNFYPKLDAFSSLEELDLCGHQKVADEDLAAILPKLPALRRLNLTWCLGLGPLTVSAVAELPKLEWLSLFGISSLPREQLLTLLERTGPRLRALDIRGIPAVQDFTCGNCQLLRERLPALEEWKLHS